MLGRKIIEVYPGDENGLNIEAVVGKGAPSLQVRRLRSAGGLRIITENEGKGNDYLQVPPPRVRHVSSDSGVPSLVTPDSTQTFGLPNLTAVDKQSTRSGPSRTSSDVSSITHHVRRQNRYSQQEDALRSSLQHTSREPSRRDLQIRALERATALLSMHAREAQERANKLRTAISQGDVDQETFKALQRERWMEERRSNARAEESKALKQLMTKLAGPDHEIIGPHSQRTQSLPSDADLAKRQANLLSFSERSPTKLMFPRRRGSAGRKRVQHVVHPPTVIAETQPLQLRAPAPVPAFAKLRPAKNSRTRTKSLQQDLKNSRAGNAPLERGPPPSAPSPLPLATTPMTVSQTQAGPSSASLGVVVNDAGVATIYASQQPRTREQIDTDMSEAVDLPSYVIDLLGGLDDIHGEVTLSTTPPARPSPLASTSTPQKARKGRGHPDHLAPPISPNKVTFPSSDRLSPPRSLQPSTPPSKNTTFAALRRPLSFMGHHKNVDSVSSAGPGSSVRMSGEGVVLAERPTTPLGSMHSLEKKWGAPTSSPAKALSKMKHRLSMMGTRR
ncbi:hypothetical protein BXZ70DRAFT_127506 [Cristinia sonorae]|uniref:Uncharacterized protein n=1 Tax=Cristinia sonorae TaxID=1940300 RepID=A0A8K0XQL2_9AGAR|nr:hypothetical protein BXZ70DRAFT_127506 [Cristinia sonorae]